MPQTQKRQTKSKKKAQVKYTIDCSHPVEDGIMEVGDFDQFLRQRIKVGGKTGNLGNEVQLAKDKNTVTVTADIPFSKRYLKYLSKKFLKKHNLRDWLRVVSSGTGSYELRYFQINNQEEEDKDDS
ncbi:large ribosomal subunit protein eL22-like [Corticium candelabrum]|uniref:large ribosomal subunit protein eL22-like n=1 Tax=Corticium candelabrum TaxID=121492 RepID=UPI002E25E03D|nr:large ribosomal subunit protein eL22-like [Corticium candelabrum]